MSLAERGARPGNPPVGAGGGEPRSAPGVALCAGLSGEKPTQKHVYSSEKWNPRHCDGNVKAQVAFVTCVCSF